MKIFATLLILLAVNMVFAQFNRSYLNLTPTLDNSFAHYLHTNEQGKTILSSLNIKDDDLLIITQELNELGDVLSIRKVSYETTLASNGVTQPLSIAGVSDRDGSRYYLLQNFLIPNGKHYELIWLKTSVASGNLQAEYRLEGPFLSNYVEAKRIGDDLVTYVVNEDKDLYRIAMNLDGFGNSSIELVSNSIATNLGGSILNSNFIKNGKKGGFITLLNNKELFTSIGENKVFVRESPSTYSSFPHSVNLGTSSYVFEINENEFAIANTSKIEIYNTQGTLVKDEAFNIGFTGGSSDVRTVFYNKNHYYLIGSVQNLGSSLITFDENFNLISQRKIELGLKSLNSCLKNEDKLYLLGVANNFNVAPNLAVDIDDWQGDIVAPSIPYVELFTDNPKIEAEEYQTRYSPHNSLLELNAGLGLHFIKMNNNNSAGATYDGTCFSYALQEFFAGKDMNETLRSNLEGNSIYSQVNVLPGPSTPSIFYNEIIESKYNRSYHVTQKMIYDHIDSLLYGSASYIPPHGIREWPGNGDVSKGQTEQVAPFVDVNNNGIYEPMEGDYPAIYGDDCLFNVTHNYSGTRLEEFQTYTYTFTCDTSDIFDDVIFRKVNIISRGVTYDSLYFGFYHDGDIGSPEDDYIGTNVDLGMTYFYNGAYDTGDPPGSYGFGDKLPAIGTMVLKGFKQDADGMDNVLGSGTNQSPNGFGYGDGINDNEHKGLESSMIIYRQDFDTSEVYTEPLYPSDILNNLKGLNKNGDTLRFGADYPFSGIYPTRYAYFGDEDTYNYALYGIVPPFAPWTQLDTDGNGTSAHPMDMRMISSFGYGELAQNEIISLDYAYVFVRDTTETQSFMDPVNLLFDKGWKIRNAFLVNEGPCGFDFGHNIYTDLSIDEYPFEENIFIYPNPSTETVKINGLTTPGSVEIYGLNGTLIKSISNYQNGEIINVEDLTNGIYLFSIQSQDQKTVKKFIKM
ncbi:MAG: T9SS type A sorting domain-containing protein [Brumimicrobium sp.]|nr:T9SS type A sorting domain-containing protein [Brumimicrobium sp.]